MNWPHDNLDETTASIGIGLIGGVLNAALTGKQWRDAILTSVCGGIMAALSAPYIHTLLAKYITDNPEGLFWFSVFFVGLLAKDALYWLLNNKHLWLKWLGVNAGKYLNNGEKERKKGGDKEPMSEQSERD